LDTYAPLFGAEAYRLGIAESERRWRRALLGSGLLLVATDRGAVVGLGHAGSIASPQLLDFLRERGVPEAQLDVVAVNAKAIAFYRSQGARPVGRRVNRDVRGDTEDLVMAIPTTAGGSG
jgi:hypothetical protein